MAEGSDRSYENPAYEPDWDDDDDDDNGDETTPFIPTESSTPAAPGQEEIPMQTMQHEKYGLPGTSYVETSFGAPTLREQAWVAAKDLFPNMSSSELEVS